MSTLSASFPGGSIPGCLVGNIQPAILMGGVFTAINVMQGAPFTPATAAVNVGFIYAYGALQCPMEALTMRRSWTHNFLAGGILGYAAVERGLAGIPYNLEQACYARRIPVPVGAGMMYGSIGAALAMFSGKPL